MNEEEKRKLFERVAESEKTRHIHTPICQIKGRQPDFTVDYEICSDAISGGVFPSQGMRCGFRYSSELEELQGIFLITPEILDSAGKVILDKRDKIPLSGLANMWIVDDEREFHRKYLRPGTTGFWASGSVNVARVRVNHINPL